MVAFVEHDEPIGDSGFVRVVGSHVNRQLTHDYGSVQGLAWSPTGSEIWYTAAESGGSARSLHAVDLAGHDRMLYRVPGALRLQDVARDGRVLFVHELIRAGILGHVPGESGERELAGWTGPFTEPSRKTVSGWSSTKPATHPRVTAGRTCVRPTDRRRSN